MMAAMRCDATSGTACTLPAGHSGRHLAWTVGPPGQREPVMWHDDRTRTQTDRMKQLHEQGRTVDPTDAARTP